MELGMVGLGRMGANMARRLMRDGHRCVVYDVNANAVSALAAEGAEGASSLEGLASKLSAPRSVWVMVPAGEITEKTVEDVAAVLDSGDAIIDGGNSYYRDDIRRAAKVGEQGIDYVDCGTSGGVFGLDRGYCLMIGGPDGAVQRLDSVFASLAPGVEAAERTPGRTGDVSPSENGYLHCGPNGAGHFVKMVHNGIEYGMMQAYAEGFEIMEHSEFPLDLHEISHIWLHGSVVRSWLLELLHQAFKEHGNKLDDIAPWVEDSGEGRWTIHEAIAENVPAPVISAALFARFASRDETNFAAKVAAALRNEFGGHAIKTVAKVEGAEDPRSH